MQFLSHSTQETEAIGEELAQKLRGGDVLAFTARSAWERPPSRAVLRAALAAADASRARRSPSSTSTGAERRSSILICTASARPDELFDIGWDDYLARGGVCAVEWSERVSDALPEDTIFVDIARTDEHEDWRTITVTGGRFA